MPALEESLQEAVRRRWQPDLPAQTRDRLVALVEVEVRRDLDSSDEPAIFVIVKLSDPPPGSDTWPVDEIWELRGIVQDAVREVDPRLDEPFYVRFVPTTADPADDGEGIEVEDGDW